MKSRTAARYSRWIGEPFSSSHNQNGSLSIGQPPQSWLHRQRRVRDGGKGTNVSGCIPKGRLDRGAGQSTAVGLRAESLVAMAFPWMNW